MAGLLGGLDGLALAAAALVLILSGPLLLRPLLVDVLQRAPFIGGWLAGNVDTGLNAYQRWLNATAQPWVAPLADALGWLAWAAGALPAAVLNVGEAAATAVSNLRHLDLPALEARAHGYAAGLVDGLRASLLGALAGAEAALGGEIAAARTEAARLVAAAEAEAANLDAAERALAEGLVAAARQDAGDLFAQAVKDAQAIGAAAEDEARALVASARADALAAVGVVEHDLAALARAANVALVDSMAVIGGDVADAEHRAADALSAAESGLQHSIDGILQSLPWQALAAGVGVAEEVLQADVRTLVMAGAAEIRKTIGDAESIRARYGPQVAAALADLKGRA